MPASPAGTVRPVCSRGHVVARQPGRDLRPRGGRRCAADNPKGDGLDLVNVMLPPTLASVRSQAAGPSRVYVGMVEQEAPGGAYRPLGGRAPRVLHARASAGVALASLGACARDGAIRRWGVVSADRIAYVVRGRLKRAAHSMGEAVCTNESAHDPDLLSKPLHAARLPPRGPAGHPQRIGIRGARRKRIHSSQPGADVRRGHGRGR